MLPDLQDALDHLRVDTGTDDAKVQKCLDAAIDAVEAFIDRGSLTAVASSSECSIEITPRIHAAILMICESLYDDRSAGQGVILAPGSTEWVLLFPSRRVGI